MKKCPCCNNKSYYKIFDFGLHPWCGDFRDLSDRNPVKKYPLKIVMCKSCKLVADTLCSKKTCLVKLPI